MLKKRLTMNRIDSTSTILYFLQNGCQQLKSLINQIIQTIWARVSQAYYEAEKVILKIEMPLHPVKNTYPKHFKKVPWPHYLDQARGTWAKGLAEDFEAMARKVEPLEKVTP